ncbi:methylglyoxal synthase [Rhodohalobacter sp. 614A]|uniref:methylglyoxal synthase n=1 Tax=Rhodohalobacter sp. 614A TaxID=2908649 RepID=UPI001F44536D|nr:methylglyoxal synthase [Rhodohalobacter sp. 614A]
MSTQKPHPSIASRTSKMGKKKKIGLVAHDYRKRDLIDWVDYNRGTLKNHELYGTGTTGGLIEEKLGLEVHRFMSGPLGGDLQLGAAIADEKLDILIFFWDPLQAQPHDVDVKALLRICVVYNIPLACNRSSADFLISSELLEKPYERFIVDYGERLRNLKTEE